MATTQVKQLPVIDQDIFLGLLPPAMRPQLTPELMKEMSTPRKNDDIQILESYRDNLIGHTSILKQGAYSLGDYAKACRFVTFILLGESQKNAYIRTFPDRYKVFKDKGFTDKQISARTSMYAKGKLVVGIREQAEMPLWLANAENLQKAINQQMYLVTHAESERVQCDAANSVMSHLKRPEKLQMEIETTENTNSVISEVLGAAERIIAAQQKQLDSGMTVKQLIDSDITEDIDHG